MCLLVVSWKLHDDYSLLIAANRDEKYDRPTLPFTVLRDQQPRTLGGRDLLAGGTWLAVNEYGVMAGLTNTPSTNGPDSSRRTRGELPLLLTRRMNAVDNVEEFLQVILPGQYNAAWLLVGDRNNLFYVALPRDEAPEVRELDAGLYVLENAPLFPASSKARFVGSRLSITGTQSEKFWRSLPSTLSIHESAEWPATGTLEARTTLRRVETQAPCVHTDDYGTRSAMLIRLATDRDEKPEILVTDGPPCITPFIDVSSYWTDRGN
jgi:uncharacterized protein with NRDE domain